MKPLLLLLGAILIWTGMVGPSRAQNYPWCAYYGAGMGGGANCGFATYGQCMATLSGNGGFCDRNTQYIPGPGAAPYPGARRSYAPQD